MVGVIRLGEGRKNYDWHSDGQNFSTFRLLHAFFSLSRFLILGNPLAHIFGPSAAAVEFS